MNVKDIEVFTEKEPSVDFKNYKTYTWKGKVEIIRDEEGRWERPGIDLGSEVKILVDKKMSELGLKIKDENPDLYLGFALGIDLDRFEIKKDREFGTVSLKNIPKSALVLLLIDVHSGYPVWLGYATGKGEEKRDEMEIKKRLEYAIDEIFSSFPR